MSSQIDEILVLNQTAHNIHASVFVEELAQRVDDVDIKFAETQASAREKIDTASILTGVRVNEELLEAATNLKLFACAAAGTDHLPLDTFREKGIAVTNASGVHATTMAEYVLGAMLIFSNNFHKAFEQKTRSGWQHFRSNELKDSTTTIIGQGAVGQEIAKKANAMDVETIGIRHSPDKAGPTDIVRGYEDDLEESLIISDYLVIAAPLTDLTESLIGADELDALPTDSVVINVGRGEIIDTESLVYALRRGSIRGACLDVTDPEPLPEDHPLWNFPNVLISPHMAGSTPKYWPNLADILVENIGIIRESGKISNLRNQIV